MPQSFLTTAWDRIKCPVLALCLVVFYRSLVAERVRFVDDRIDAGYATYRTLAIFDVSIESLFPVQLGLGPVPITITPHFSFVKAHLGHQGEVWSRDGGNEYMMKKSSFSSRFRGAAPGTVRETD